MPSYRSLNDIEISEVAPYGEFVKEQTIFEIFNSLASNYGDRPAIRFLETCEIGEKAKIITHSEFFGRIVQTANMFADFGIRNSDTVAYLLPSFPETHYVLWGAECVGVACAINYQFKPDQAFHLLDAVEAKILVIPGRKWNAELYDQAIDMYSQVSTLETIIVIGDEKDEANNVFCYEDIIDRYPCDNLIFKYRKTPDDLAAILHTGGTTGMPKLVQQSQGGQAFIAKSLSTIIELDENDVFMSGLPLFHSGGIIDFSLSPLAVGASIVIPTPAGMRSPNTVNNYWKIVESQRITVLAAIPTSFAAILSVSLSGEDISSVRFGMSGGSSMPKGVSKDFNEIFDIKLYQGYGITECSGLVTVCPPSAEWHPTSVGLRLPFTRLKVVKLKSDGTIGDECMPGVSGVVITKGPHVFPGYRNSAQNKGVLEDDWLITGDLGYIDENGWLYLSGRSKDLIIRSGQNIDPQIIEEIIGQYPGIELCAAVGMPDKYAGEIPIAYVTVQNGKHIDVDTLMEFVRQNIAEVHARPREIFIIDTMPTTTVGKILKLALRIDAAKKGIGRILEDAEIKSQIIIENSSSNVMIAKILIKHGSKKKAKELLDKLQLNFEII